MDVVRHTAWQRPPTTRPTTFHVWKSRGCQCSFRLLMMGGVSPETRWASYKYGIIKFWYVVASCWIFFLWNVLWCTDPRTSSFQMFLCYLHASLALMSIYCTRKLNVEQKYKWFTQCHSTQKLPRRSSLSECRKVSRYTRKFSSTSIYCHKDTTAFPAQIVSDITKAKLHYMQISYRFQTHRE